VTSTQTSETRGRQNRRLISPVTLRILAINVLALGSLVAGTLYLDKYRENLIDAELTALATQAEMFAVALSEGAVAEATSGQYRVSKISHQMLRRLVQTTGTRARLFDANGRLVADSRRLARAGGAVDIEVLPPLDGDDTSLDGVFKKIDRVLGRWFGRLAYPPYRESTRQNARDYPEMIAALRGDYVKTVRAAGRDHIILGVAVPVQCYKQVLGALKLTIGSRRIEGALYEVRRDILQVFVVILAITVLLSIYLAGTIARPLRRLAAAAELMRRDHSRRHQIPDMTARGDEIGELSATLIDMTEALWQRMDAIERFAADVSHEIKNPLTSLRSAVETTARIKDPDQQRKLMTVIETDVLRLDRLISDISDASRIDAELSRAEIGEVDLGSMLLTLADIHNATTEDGPRVKLIGIGGAAWPICVSGNDGRLAQVFRNLLSNAASFSSKPGVITISATCGGDGVTIYIDDDGPGVTAGMEQMIFRRFYTERRDGEEFGSHSGLGLSISQQIVKTHGGSLTAANRIAKGGSVLGARFSVWMPTL